ncbi:luciferase family protein [Haloarchaeobius sp. TZWWS8]|uniref:luciferase domain-containing protein n=1 Tax=Haloarchaeobius sp. TZWWS8 TaxID=3446121 RepID=UPI003EB6972E
MESDSTAVADVVVELVREVREWPGVRLEAHRYGGTAFLVGSREIGHVHEWGMLDVAYLRALRDALVAEGRTAEHHLLANSGWTTFEIEKPGDLEHARWLVRLSYLYHVNALQQRGTGDAELDAVDVEHELEALGVSDAVRDAFFRKPPASAT